MSTAAVIQARMGSSRLPGKVLRAIGSTTMLEKVVQRLARASSLDLIVVATTEDPADEELVRASATMGIPAIRGDRYDVLERFGTFLDEYTAVDTVVRITADCPFVDPGIVDDLVGRLKTTAVDFVANRLPPPWDRTYPIGLDVEVCTRQALLRARRDATAPHQREHVMPFIYENPQLFSIHVDNLDEDLSGFRWTVDTVEDLRAARELDRLCGDEPYSWRRVLEVAVQHPWIGSINAASGQKHVRSVDDRWRSSDHDEP